MKKLLSILSVLFVMAACTPTQNDLDGGSNLPTPSVPDPDPQSFDEVLAEAKAYLTENTNSSSTVISIVTNNGVITYASLNYRYSNAYRRIEISYDEAASDVPTKIYKKLSEEGTYSTRLTSSSGITFVNPEGEIVQPGLYNMIIYTPTIRKNWTFEDPSWADATLVDDPELYDFDGNMFFMIDLTFIDEDNYQVNAPAITREHSVQYLFSPNGSS